MKNVSSPHTPSIDDDASKSPQADSEESVDVAMHVCQPFRLASSAPVHTRQLYYLPEIALLVTLPSFVRLLTFPMVHLQSMSHSLMTA